MEIERRHDSASSKQTRIFSFLSKRRRDAVSRAWEMSLAFVVHAPLDLNTLERAFRSTVLKHVESRSVFHDARGALRVETAPAASFALSGAPDRRLSREEALAMANADVWRGFARYDAPLIALRVYPHDDRTTLLALQVSHLVTDGAGVEILVNDLMLAYLAGGQAPPRDPRDLSFADYVDWEERFVASEDGAAQGAFWKERQPPERQDPPLPYKLPHRGDGVERGGALRFDAGPGVSQWVAETARRLGVTPFSILLTAFMRACAAWTGRADLSISFALARRHLRDFVNAFGDFAYACPIDCARACTASFETGVRAVASEIQQMTLRQDFPLAVLDPNWRSTARVPPQGLPGFPYVSFGPVSGLRRDSFGLSALMHTLPGTRVKVGEIEVESVSLDTEACGRDLLVSYVPRAQGIAFSLNYNADRFDPATIAALAEAMREQFASL